MKKASGFGWHKQVKESLHVKSQMKTMFVNFSDIRGIIHFKFMLQGQTVDQAYYVEILKQLHEAVCRRMPEFWPSD
jgi:hypothetical protein